MYIFNFNYNTKGNRICTKKVKYSALDEKHHQLRHSKSGQEKLGLFTDKKKKRNNKPCAEQEPRSAHGHAVN